MLQIVHCARNAIHHLFPGGSTVAHFNSISSHFAMTLYLKPACFSFLLLCYQTWLRICFSHMSGGVASCMFTSALFSSCLSEWGWAECQHPDRGSTYKRLSQPYANPNLIVEGFRWASTHWLTTIVALLLVRGVFEVAC